MKRRWLVLFASWIVFFVAFLDRVNLSVAMPSIAKEFNLPPSQQGFILSAFFITYAFSQIPGGILGDKIGPKKVISFALIWWSILTIITGLTRSFSQLYIIRVLFGLGEGLHPPCAFKLNSNWFPNKEKATANAIFTSANSIGPAVAPSLAVAIIGLFGWRSIFYIFGLLGALVIPLWLYAVRNAPTDDPKISKEELDYIQNGQLNEIANDSSSENDGGLKSIFKNPNTILLALAYFTFLCTFYGLLTWLPTYLVKARGFTLVKMGIFAGLPFLTLGLAQPIGGWISDKLLNGKRNIQVILASLLSAPALYCVVISNSETTAILALVVAGFILGLAFGPFWALPMECVNRKYVGTATGIMNTGGNIGGIVSPIIIGFLVTSYGYNSVFLFMVAAQIATAIIMVFVHQPKAA